MTSEQTSDQPSDHAFDRGDLHTTPEQSSPGEAQDLAPRGGTIPYPGLTGDMEVQPDHGESSYVGAHKLDGKVAVITGGDSGIGRAVALAYAKEGADVVISYLPQEEEDAEATLALVVREGRECTLVPGDLTSAEACEKLIGDTVEKYGRLDILVTNAAHQYSQPGGIADIDDEQLERTIGVNLTSMFRLCRSALPHMPDGEASIIATASIQASDPSSHLLDYAMTKGGVVAFVKGLAEETASRGIRVNAVAPGPVWTPLIPATMTEDKIESFGKDTPLGRPAQPAELAPSYVFLASRDASYITGEVLMVTGGK